MKKVTVTKIKKHAEGLRWAMCNIDAHKWRYNKFYDDYKLYWEWEFTNDEDALLFALMFT